ncbi:type IV secretory system conjugative DNA transfer family protein [Bradyrhizobium sp. CSA207]|uniref:type IV secretory system conjugative DNA transfer family protein n=1 Tax=Bradyrhizobium sp. CSA207 TaxID=2698826 RepID=UPI0023B0BA7D|nr:type IV secretory system conjugative DNA transfer family protein [Bradyrhizobium sp. CSA207]MDE5441082.1 type IV secretory system conjugative DNA transfer family protein [Bradyrhizobium sp. CSA207]
MLTSPDRPASFLHQWVGIKDQEPPITDEEFRLYQTLRENLQYAPADIARGISTPSAVNRRTRAAVRKIVSDPGLPALLSALERAKSEALAEDERRSQERRLVEAREAELRLQGDLAKIDTIHDNQLNDLCFELGELEQLIGKAAIKEASLRIALESQSQWTKNQRSMNLNTASSGGGGAAVVFGALANIENRIRDGVDAHGIASGMSKFAIRRSLVSMSDAERAILRMADVLSALGHMERNEYLRIAVPIAWNGGDCAYEFGVGFNFNERAAALDVLKQLLNASVGTVGGAREYLNQAVRAALEPASGLAAPKREIIERYLFSGNRWMTEAEGQRAHARDDLSASALRIGGFPGTKAEFIYDKRESLVTLAPSGSGKTQSHVLRNLLYMEAPALVLDVKGEMHDQTRQWREENVGPTYLFKPTDPDESLHFNPIDEIRTDPDLAWDDARRLADFLMVPSGRTSRDDSYWENRARDMITLALLDVALNEAPEHRNMAGVLDRIFTSGDEEILQWCEQLEESGNRQLILGASALKGLDKKPRESVFDTARAWLEIWTSPAIRKISADSNFDPGCLRKENATLYLAVKLEDIRKFASILRVLIGQALIKVYREKPETDARTITFFLDELVRLGRMDVIEESLDVGRGYGVRLWLFCQNFGQLEVTYPNAKGMVSNCAVRCYMNPDEDAARWMSENLGTRQGLLDGNRKPLVEHHVLTGPEFNDQMVVFSRGAPPARLTKMPAYADAECQARSSGNWTKPQPPAPPVIQSAPSVENAIKAEPQGAEASVAPPPSTLRSEPAKSADVNWDTLLVTATPPWSSERRTAAKSDADKRPIGTREIVYGAVLVGLGWLVTQTTKPGSEQADNITLAAALKTADRERKSLRQEKDSWSETLRQAERLRDQYLKDFRETIVVLNRERDDHRATQDRLAKLQREFEAERARNGKLPATTRP